MSYTANQEFWMKYADPDQEEDAPVIERPSVPDEYQYAAQYHVDHAAAVAANQDPATLDPNNYTLTDAEGRQYSRAFERYRTVDLLQYRDDLAVFQRVMAYITETCGKHAKSMLLPNDTIRANLKILRERFGMTDEEERREARAAYRQAIIPPRNMTWKAMEEWLTNWELAFQKADIAGLPEADDREIWCTDIKEAIGDKQMKLQATWTMLKMKTIPSMNLHAKPGVFSYRDVAAAIRDEWKEEQKRPIALPMRRGTAFPAKAAPEGDESGQPSVSLKGDKRQRSSTQSTSTSETQAKRPTQKCKACRGYHATKDCYLAFPDHPDKPADFRLNTKSWRYKNWIGAQSDPEVVKLIKKIAKQMNMRHAVAETDEMQEDNDIQA
jgi:hypothetical protein